MLKDFLFSLDISYFSLLHPVSRKKIAALNKTWSRIVFSIIYEHAHPVFEFACVRLPLERVGLAD